MARVILNRGPEAKATCAQFMRRGVRKCVESLGHDPKPDDLALGKVKRG